MANDDVKQRITGWCTPADDLQVSGERPEPDHDFALQLITGGGSGSDVVAALARDADHLVLRHTVTLDGDALGSAKDTSFDEELAELVEGRPGPVSAWTSNESGQHAVVLQTWVYLDGLTKHSFMSALSELTRTRRVLERAAGLLPAATADAVAPAPAATPMAEPAAAYAPMPVAEPVAAPQPIAAPQPYTPAPYQAQPATVPQPAPQPAASAWTPSHKVPGQGMQAWGAPDPSGPVLVNLGGNLPVKVQEMRGAWAHVLCSNGWTGWVDGRLLVQGG